MRFDEPEPIVDAARYLERRANNCKIAFRAKYPVGRGAAPGAPA
jgi:hypothetical protein